MKKTIKLFGIIALVAVIGFSMAACSDNSGDGDGSNNGVGDNSSGGNGNANSNGNGGNIGGGDIVITTPPTFNTVEEMRTWLLNQPANGSYIIKLNIDNIDDFTKLRMVLINADNKYINLDLSGGFITSIPENAFISCATLTGITIPNTVTSIVGSAFSGCYNLNAINVSAANIAYSSTDGVLYNKNKTTLVAYPSVKDSYTIPNNVISIDRYAFDGCAGLISVNIPASVNYIGSYAFNGCTNLISVTFATGSNFSTPMSPWEFLEVEGGNIFDLSVFPEGSNGNGGDSLRNAYSTGKAGTYTRAINGDTWTKQP